MGPALGALGFVLLPSLLMYYASLWFEKLPARSRLLEITSVVGFCAVIASSLSDSAAGLPLDRSLGTCAKFSLQHSLSGSAMSGMCWGLVPGDTGIIAGADQTPYGDTCGGTRGSRCGACPDGVARAWDGSTSLLPRVQHLLVAYPYFLLGRALVGWWNVWVGGLTMWLLREGSTQAATGSCIPPC